MKAAWFTDLNGNPVAFFPEGGFWVRAYESGTLIMRLEPLVVAHDLKETVARIEAATASEDLYQLVEITRDDDQLRKDIGL